MCDAWFCCAVTGRGADRVRDVLPHRARRLGYVAARRAGGPRAQGNHRDQEQQHVDGRATLDHSDAQEGAGE